MRYLCPQSPTGDKSGGRVEILEKSAGSDPATKPFRKEYVWKRR